MQLYFLKLMNTDYLLIALCIVIILVLLLTKEKFRVDVQCLNPFATNSAWAFENGPLYGDGLNTGYGGYGFDPKCILPCGRIDPKCRLQDWVPFKNRTNFKYVENETPAPQIDYDFRM